MHPLLSRPWRWLHGLRPAQPGRAPRRTKLNVESLEDRLALSASPISPASEYVAWRDTRFTIDDAVQTQPDAGGAVSAQGANASFGSDVNLDGAFADFSYRGQGYAVAVIDTGIDYNNVNLGAGWGQRVVAGWNFVANNNNPMDDNGHGTHVAGIIASSSSTYSGVAPQANLIALKVLDKSGSGTFGAVDDALQWVVDHQAQYNIVAVNLSLGSGVYASNPYTFLENDFTQLQSEGVFVAVAAGNDYYGHSQGLAYPAISPNVVSVGAVWAGNFGAASWASGAKDYSSSADQIVSFSQRSTSLDLLAPGALITSTYLGNGTKTMAGTSMSTPVVTGAAVLVHEALDAQKQSGVSQSGILQILQNTGVSITDTDRGKDNVTHTGLTFKRIDISAALHSIQGAPRTPTAPTLDPLGSKVMAWGRTAAVSLNGADADGDPLTYSATLHDASGLAYTLRQQLGLSYAGSYYTNAWGYNEHWLQGSGGSWYCLMPTGDLRRWAGTMTATLEASNLLGCFGSSYYADPSLLWNAQPAASPPVGINITGNVLYIGPNTGYTGTFQVDVTVSDGQASASQTLTVTVIAPTAPQLGSISAMSMDAGATTTITLPGSDADGDPLVYSAQLLGSYGITPASLSISANRLTIQTTAAFSGDFDVQVSVTDGTSTATTTFRVTVSAGVGVVARFPGNFNGDGWADTVEFHSDGSWWVTLSGGSPAAWSQWLPAMSWRSVMVGDFNGDRMTDIGGFSNDGSWWVGLSTGSSFTTDSWAQWLPAANWDTILTGDFNGDKKTDVVGYSNDGTWWVGRSTGGRFVTGAWTTWLTPSHWKTVSAGDFNGDGKTDIIGFNNDGTWWVGQSTGSRFATSAWTKWLPASHWSTVLVGDFNGDGRSDVIGMNNDGSWWVGLSDNGRFATSRWAQWSPASNWVTVTVGDVNGDGKTDIVGLSNDGSWWIGYAGNGSFSTRLWNSSATQTAGTTKPGVEAASTNGAWAAWLGLADAMPTKRYRPRRPARRAQ